MRTIASVCIHPLQERSGPRRHAFVVQCCAALGVPHRVPQWVGQRETRALARSGRLRWSLAPSATPISGLAPGITELSQVAQEAADAATAAHGQIWGVHELSATTQSLVTRADRNGRHEWRCPGLASDTVPPSLVSRCVLPCGEEELNQDVAVDVVHCQSFNESSEPAQPGDYP